MINVSVKAAEQEYKMYLKYATRQDAPQAEKDYYAKGLAVVSSYYEAAKAKAKPKKDQQRRPAEYTYETS